MDGEAGWWTTSGNIGLPPLARAMGVGRQQQLMGSGVLTTRGTSACASENKSVREAAAAAALPVKQVTAEVRRVTQQCLIGE